MGKAHFLVFCDRQLVENAIPLILECDARIEVISKEIIETESIEDTTETYELRRGSEQACVSLIVGDKESQVGPYDGEYWIFIDGEPEGLFKCNEPFARELTEILIANGATSKRKVRRQG